MGNTKFISYVRVSTSKQDYGLEAQLNEINKYVASKGSLIASYTEKKSGKKNDREELTKAIEHCKKENATLIVSKLDRLSRDASFTMQLHESNLNFVVVDNPNLTTLTIGIYATIAQHERELISLRTKAGLEVARSRGRFGGRVRGCQLKDTQKSNIGSTLKVVHSKKKSVIVSFLNKNKNTHKGKVNIILDLLNDNGFKTSKNNSFTLRSVKPLLPLIAL